MASPEAISSIIRKRQLKKKVDLEIEKLVLIEAAIAEKESRKDEKTGSCEEEKRGR